jgi:hypothetical protein
MASEELRGLFGEDLSSEFSLENLLFLEDVNAFTTKVKELSPEAPVSGEQQVLLEEVRVLFDTYVAAGSPFEVNLPGTMRAQTRDRLEQKGTGGLASLPASQLALVFGEAYAEVFELLSHDSFRRFQAQNMSVLTAHAASSTQQSSSTTRSTDSVTSMSPPSQKATLEESTVESTIESKVESKVETVESEVLNTTLKPIPNLV